MNTKTVLAFASMLVLSACTSLHADYFLEFKPQSPLVLGGSTTVDIVLRETRASGSTSALGTSVTNTGSFRFTWVGSSAYTVSNLQDHGDQGGRTFDNNGGAATIELNTLSSFGTVDQFDVEPIPGLDPLGTVNSSIEATLRLGSFVLSGGAVGETISFQMEDFSAFDDITLDDGTVLDSVIQYGNMDFSVSAVPEPSSMVALGVLASGIGLRHWRKRRLAKSKNND